MPKPLNVLGALYSLFNTSDSKNNSILYPIHKLEQHEDGTITIVFNFAGEVGEDATVELDTIMHMLHVSLDSETRTYETRIPVNPYLQPEDITCLWSEGQLTVNLERPSADPQSGMVDIGIHAWDANFEDEFMKFQEEDISVSESDPLAPVIQLFSSSTDSEFYNTVSTFVNIITRRGGQINELDLIAEASMLLENHTTDEIQLTLMKAYEQKILTLENGIVTL